MDIYIHHLSARTKFLRQEYTCANKIVPDQPAPRGAV